MTAINDWCSPIGPDSESLNSQWLPDPRVENSPMAYTFHQSFPRVGFSGPKASSVALLPVLNPQWAPNPLAVALPAGGCSGSLWSPVWSPPQQAGSSCTHHGTPFTSGPPFAVPLSTGMARGGSDGTCGNLENDSSVILLPPATASGGQIRWRDGSSCTVCSLPVADDSVITVPPRNPLRRRGSCSEPIKLTALASRLVVTSHHHGGSKEEHMSRCVGSELAAEAGSNSERLEKASLPAPCKCSTTQSIATATDRAGARAWHHPAEPHHADDARLAGSKRSWSSSLAGDVAVDGSLLAIGSQQCSAHAVTLSRHCCHNDGGSNRLELEPFSGQAHGLGSHSQGRTALPLPQPAAVATPPPSDVPTAPDSAAVRCLSHWADGLAAMIAMEQAQRSQAEAALQGAASGFSYQKARIAMEQARGLGSSQPASGAGATVRTACTTATHSNHRDGSNRFLPQTEGVLMAVTSVELEPAAWQEVVCHEPEEQHGLATASAPPTATAIATAAATATAAANTASRLPLAQRMALLVSGPPPSSTDRRAMISQPGYRSAAEVGATAGGCSEEPSEVQVERGRGASRARGIQAGEERCGGRRGTMVAIDRVAQWRRQKRAVAATSASVDICAAVGAQPMAAGVLSRRRQSER